MDDFDLIANDEQMAQLAKAYGEALTEHAEEHCDPRDPIPIFQNAHLPVIARKLDECTEWLARLENFSKTGEELLIYREALKIVTKTAIRIKKNICSVKNNPPFDPPIYTPQATKKRAKTALGEALAMLYQSHDTFPCSLTRIALNDVAVAANLVLSAV